MLLLLSTVKVFDEFNAGNLSETELKQTLKAQADDVSSIIANDMKDPNKAFKQAQGRLNDVIKNSETWAIVQVCTPLLEREACVCVHIISGSSAYIICCKSCMMLCNFSTHTQIRTHVTSAFLKSSSSILGHKY